MEKEKALPLTAGQRAELDRRLDAYEADGDRGRPAPEAVAGIRRALSPTSTGARAER